MKKKVILLPLLLVLFSGILSAAPVSEETAHRVAVNFWNTYRPESQKAVESLQTRTFPGMRHMYFFVNDELGFVIVSADDRVQPILGYSFDSPLAADRLNNALQYWLNGYEEQIEVACATDRSADPRWNTLLDNPVPPTPLTLTNIPKLCSTTWDQGNPYNELCPYDDNYEVRTVVGCVATAMAQIMKYWNHPSRGNGSHFYTHYNSDLPYSYGMLSADFENTTYLWEFMPDRLTTTGSATERMAVSTLSYHCGVAVDMMYGPSITGGSGAYSYCYGTSSACAVTAFYRYFKYEPTLVYRPRSAFNDSVWLSMIDADLEQGRPLYYNGRDEDGGHAFVLDGSDLDTHYHFNWGWSGWGDGFYAMSNLAPGSGGAGGNSTYTFNLEQGAIFGIVPIPEAGYDTVEVWDTTCTNHRNYPFYEYTLPVANADTLLRHLDTVFLLHLRRSSTYMLTFRPNNGVGNEFEMTYCFKDTVVMPECPFTRDRFIFRGWCRSKRGDDEIFQSGDSVMLRGHQIFYALWRDTTVGVDVVDDGDFNLWPNPTTGELFISMPVDDEVQVLVVDAVGRIVLQRDCRDERRQGLQISLAGLPAGVYTLQLRNSAGVYNRRIVKQ